MNSEYGLCTLQLCGGGDIKDVSLCEACVLPPWWSNCEIAAGSGPAVAACQRRHQPPDDRLLGGTCEAEEPRQCEDPHLRRVRGEGPAVFLPKRLVAHADQVGPLIFDKCGAKCSTELAQEICQHNVTSCHQSRLWSFAFPQPPTPSQAFSLEEKCPGNFKYLPGYNDLYCVSVRGSRVSNLCQAYVVQSLLAGTSTGTLQTTS